MKFDDICDSRISKPTDLLSYLISNQAKEFSTVDLRTVFKAINLVDLRYRDDVRGMLMAIQSSKKPGFEAAGVVYLRLAELRNPELPSLERNRQAVDLMTCMVEKSHTTLNARVLAVATGIYDYLAYREPALAQYFADDLIACAETNPHMALALMTKPNDQDIDPQPFYSSLYQAIGKSGDVKTWIKQKIPARLRQIAANNTGFKEFLQTMGKADKGKFLENQLGL
jgi:hypothetical protein